tara:strand:- start:546 stop:956 length:411 start_codon:yes stop_codon:yes gene_type:complete
MLKKLIQCKYTNEWYYAINTINASEKAELQTIVNKYKEVVGDYCATLIGGIAHYMCDSGIMSDAYSRKDVDYINKNLKHLISDEEGETEAFYEALHLHENELEFMLCLAELNAFSEKYKYNNEEVISLASDMDEQL